MPKWLWVFKQLTSRLWLRAGLFGVIGIGSALVAVWFKDYLPQDLSHEIGADAVDEILNIMASSMLAVTTFSVNIMVSAYSAAANSATPRATSLLLADHKAQNALSSFIGAFLFSLVGIITLKIGAYGQGGRLLLFVVTIIVILFVILTLISWIEYLSRLGRVGETIDRVEKAAVEAATSLIAAPFLGGRELDAYEAMQLYPVRHPNIGYVQHIDMATLEEIAADMGAPIRVIQRPGAFNDSCRPIAYLTTPLAGEVIDKLQDCFAIGGERSFGQDLRYGVIVLSEIASRALSPAVNDPGTAIDVIGTLVRVLIPLTRQGDTMPDAKYPHVLVPAINVGELLDDGFRPIARDGASLLEVGIRLQKGLRSLTTCGDDLFAAEANRQADYALQQSLQALVLDEDKARLKAFTMSIDD